MGKKYMEKTNIFFATVDKLNLTGELVQRVVC